MDNSFFDELNEIPDEAKTNQADVVGDNEISKVVEPYEKARKQLEESKKTNIFGKKKNNSEEFLMVLGNLQDLIATIGRLETPTNNEYLVGAADRLANEMRDLINTGQKYMRKTGGFFSQGKARKKLVGALIKQLYEDRQGLQAGAESYDYKKHNSNLTGFSWYHFMREQTVDLGNVSYDTLQDVDGEYSGIKQLGDNVDTLGGSYFKEDMNVYKNENSNMHSVLNMAYALSDKSEYPLSPEEREELSYSVFFGFSDIQSNSPSIVLFKKYFQIALDFEKRNWGKATSAKTEFFQKDINEQEYTNLNNREVAAYKIAVLLGQPSLFARAQRGVIKSKAGGEEESRTGTIVENVNGTNAALAHQSILKDDIERFKAMGLGSIKQYEKQYDKLYNAVSGTFIKSMLNLQVLDYICNVPERKLEDMVVKEDDQNKVVSVTGINNTTAFGAGKPDNGVLSKGMLNLAYMDLNLAQSIRLLTKDMLVYELKDLISDAEIAGAWDRVSRLQTAIQKQMDLDPGAFVVFDEDWEANKGDLFLEAGEDNSSYFGKYVNSKIDINSDEASRRIGMSLAQDWLTSKSTASKEVWNDKLREVCEEGIGKAEFEKMLDKYDLMPWFGPQGIMDDKYVKDAISSSLKKEFIGKLATALYNCRIKNNANA
ncbi:hypothetical protein SAMN05216351_101295 [Pseudobutyrivibrio sp. JW11]|nr:hypothetical protein SAMN05216351_101295 [Pseudobutyrivibrio sp. JW11]